MTCKDCVHCDVCQEIESLPCRDKFVWYRLESGCPYFKDKSKIIELPCEVGNTVYRIYSRRWISEDKVLELGIINGKLYYTDQNERMTDCEKVFGKTVFLTREEAEKALKELNNE